MPKYKDISGQVFGSLTVLRLDPNHSKYPQKWVCVCSCGNEFSVLKFSLTSGRTNNCQECGRKKLQKASNEMLISAYKEHNNIWKVAELYGMCGQSVHERLVKLGVELNNQPLSNEEELFIKDNYEDFASRGRLDVLSKQMGRTKNFLCRQAKALGVNTRNNRKKKLYDDFDTRFRHPDMYKDRVHPKGMLGKKHTEETIERLSVISKRNQEIISLDKEKRSSISRKMVGTKHKRGNLVNHRIKQTWKAGWRNIEGKDFYFRSRWESNYAMYLNYLKINGIIYDWQHEPQIFIFNTNEKGMTSYLPDFKVIHLDNLIEYHEMKGWMDSRSVKKIELMSTQYPDVKLKILDSKWYNSNKRSLSKIVNGWEHD